MTGPVGFTGALHLVFFALIIPVGAWVSGRQIGRRPLPPRKPYFRSVILQQLAFLTISLGVAWHLGIPVLGEFRPTLPGVAAAAGLFLAAVLGLRPAWNRQVQAADRRVHLVAPRDGVERRLWAGVSLAAGVGEEISYRGVLFALLVAVTGSVWLAVALASVAFGLGHLVQGWRGAAIVTGFAAGFHGLVLLTGSLHLAILVHVAYDIVAGLSYGRLADAAGLPMQAPEPGEAAETA